MLVNRFDAHCLFFLQVVDNMRVAMLYPHAEFFFLISYYLLICFQKNIIYSTTASTLC